MKEINLNLSFTLLVDNEDVKEIKLGKKKKFLTMTSLEN